MTTHEKALEAGAAREAEELLVSAISAFRNKGADAGVSIIATALAAKDAEIARLREALSFYAEVSKYPAPLTGGMGELWSDCGQVARRALTAGGQHG